MNLSFAITCVTQWCSLLTYVILMLLCLCTVTLVTLSPSSSEARVRFPAWPQVGKLVVACRWSTVYSTEPWPTVCTGFLCPSNYPSWYDLYSVESDIKSQVNKINTVILPLSHLWKFPSRPPGFCDIMCIIYTMGSLLLINLLAYKDQHPNYGNHVHQSEILSIIQKLLRVLLALTFMTNFFLSLHSYK